MSINGAQISIMQLNKEILTEIKKQIGSKSFRETELYKLLRDELSGIGNWKAKPRGKPDVKNFYKPLRLNDGTVLREGDLVRSL